MWGEGVHRIGKGIRNQREIDTFKIGYWNIAGLLSKDKQFWDFLKEIDVIGLVETWIEEKQWEGLKDKLPQEFSWKCKYATRERKKGRAIGGIITGIRKGIEEEGSNAGTKHIEERRIKIQNEKWRIITVYSRDMKETEEELDQIIEKKDVEKLIIGGDFNARIGQEGGDFRIEEKHGVRRSKDKVKNTEGKVLLEVVEERGWNILNGNMEGDEKGEYTCTGPRGSTVIDYIITNVEAEEEIKKFTVEERVESDHMPLIAELYGGNKRGEREGNQKERWRERRVWTEEGRREFQIELNKTNFIRTEMNEMVEEMIRKINNAVRKEEVKIKTWKLGSFKWWNSNCTKKKREARKALRIWRRGKGDKEGYQKKEGSTKKCAMKGEGNYKKIQRMR
ncbi:uncharacterized protein LOC143371907 [Andrena cerasifolii]|uniref:uncharacterized protein LOC143371907 n=1 Tax=Andrena cerasifolii TaxID=2819439 RepID=UPI0040376B60